MKLYIPNYSQKLSITIPSSIHGPDFYKQQICLYGTYKCEFNAPKSFALNYSYGLLLITGYLWLFLWDYTFYKWGFGSTYNWYNSGLTLW